MTEAFTYDPDEHEAIHGWFGLTYSNYLVLHRSLLQSMPDEWQRRFVGCLREMQDCFGHLDFPHKYRINAVDVNGRFVKDTIPTYDRGRTRVPCHQKTPDGPQA